ncbi:similar to Saccharomyces cerevisiae YJL024C APS3 Small subunit of the clathrin- associated adaptor complex AP-3, which is involved in vacuolar protein sorting [Maudiozyma barnettii]|uniref:AP complex subunit sigma n=1 Tax=Maudiozyma barnettii TaxID=61262 RepID=A0A8H2ZJJ2_9SACH|nr:Aps3p [Kazachstania barnettii]CAB4256592.1 similar to Saccharomyces cerevisiae YJL024C APS3 Small subunit of the clathrin- associated adaptor complex AP-3, which is involved in vacuolar protein sorting [Kazachstania barnettii]CAD1785195.1 similar to Saccharomyces cerevisiae YJL024C APS3 Small subunit of the clathrin- associated adaptor complex AP-3, which is involved in vacuolar protein sorting [Kazachstania barnettii]
MIHSVLIFNKKCQPRLVKFYTPVDLPKQKLLLEQVYELISQRNTDFQSSFLVTPPSLLDTGNNTTKNNGNDDDGAIQIIYKNYATLFFTFIVDEQESELAILDLIQTFVESLDRCFTEVNELDLIFNWQTLESILEEIIQGGMVIETDITKIVGSVDDLNKASETTSNSISTGISGAFQAFAQGGFAQWATGQ